MENLLTISLIPVFLIFVLLEYFYLKKKNQSHIFRFNDAITNLNIGVGHLLTRLFTGFILIGAYTYFYNIAPIKLPENIWTWIACFFLYDFFFYWAHRWGHEVNLFWAAHSVHHQSEDYNLSVALRQSWLHALLAFVIFLPVPFMGMPAEIFFINAAISGLYQFWIHTETIHKMPKWFEYIFNTPSHHRVHHAVNPEYIDKNHGATLIIWDRMFGTFAQEVKHPSYGVTKQINTWNPLWSNLIYFSDLWEASKLMKWKDKLILIFKKPGWRPEYLGGMMPIPEVSENTIQKYDITPISNGLNTYVLIQFLLIVLGSVGFLYYFNILSPFQQLTGFSALLLSLIICGAILEQKGWVKYVEYLRLLIALTVINSIYYISFQNWFKITLFTSVLITIYLMIWYTLNSWFKIQFIDWAKIYLKK
jgi:sterol desaturase/sphingolipid hydroxylase (fatty acid hydroxylase superfamily)